MASKSRARRVGDRIQEELATILHEQVSDPRLTMITITGVDVDRELAFATIYVSAMGDSERAEEVVKALEAAGGYLRRELVARIQMRAFPQIRFRWDTAHERGSRVDELLDQLRIERGEPAGDSGDAD
jgi:ribosome-binding factor A